MSRKNGGQSASGSRPAVVAGVSPASGHNSAADTDATTANRLFLSDLFSLTRRSVSLFDRVSLGHVFALLGRAVKTRSFPVVHMRFRVNPHETVAAARRRRVGRCLRARALRRRTARGRRTCRRRTLRLEHVAEIKFRR